MDPGNNKEFLLLDCSDTGVQVLRELNIETLKKKKPKKQTNERVIQYETWVVYLLINICQISHGIQLILSS